MRQWRGFEAKVMAGGRGAEEHNGGLSGVRETFSGGLIF